MDYFSRNIFDVTSPQRAYCRYRLCMAGESELLGLFGADKFYYHNLIRMFCTRRSYNDEHYTNGGNLKLGTCQWCDQLYRSIQNFNSDHLDHSYYDDNIPDTYRIGREHQLCLESQGKLFGVFNTGVI